MASEKEASCQNYCANDPNFAIICSFFDRFATTCGITHPTFSELQEMIETSQDVPPELIDLHVRLLRKIRRSVATEKWERALIKFCHSYYCSEDGWELESCGYKKCKVPVRLRILKTLLDAQFDLNTKFKNDINKLTAEELRLEPLGRDKVGQSYWCQFDSAANVRVYKEDQDEETWKLVAKDREGLVELITQLSSGEELLGLELINEDSNSQEVEKPIIDTGQVEMSTSEENTTDNTSSIDVKIENSVKDENNSNSVSTSQNGSHGNEQEESNSLHLDKHLEKDEEGKVLNTASKSPIDHVKENNEYSTSDTVGVIKDNDFNPIINQDQPEKSELNEGLTSTCSSVNEVTKDTQIAENVSDHLSLDKNAESNSIDVAEEIKQRLLFKSNSLTLFRGRTGKNPTGSKLDQIFSRKMEQSNVGSIVENNSAISTKSPSPIISDKQDILLPNDIDELSNQTSTQISDKDDDSSSNDMSNKRKHESSCEISSKKVCMEPEPNSEVGEAIEEPLLIIKGEGSGKECDTGNPGQDNETEVTAENLNNGHASNNDVIVENNDIKTISDPKVTQLKNDDESLVDTQTKNNDVNKCVLANENSNKTFFDKSCNETVKSDMDESSSPRHLQNESIQESQEKKGDREILPDGICNKHDDKYQLNLSNEHEKSIEEQLSDLTGECLSPCPSQNADNSQTTDNSFLNKENVVFPIRRKSLDCTASVDNEAMPSEAKKTKVLQDSLDIFGCIDESPTNVTEHDDKNMVEDCIKESTNKLLQLKDSKNNLNSENKCNSDTVLSDNDKSNEANSCKEAVEYSNKLNEKEEHIQNKDDLEDVEEEVEQLSLKANSSLCSQENNEAKSEVQHGTEEAEDDNVSKDLIANSCNIIEKDNSNTEPTQDLVANKEEKQNKENKTLKKDYSEEVLMKTKEESVCNTLEKHVLSTSKKITAKKDLCDSNISVKEECSTFTVNKDLEIPPENVEGLETLPKNVKELETQPENVEINLNSDTKTIQPEINQPKPTVNKTDDNSLDHEPDNEEFKAVKDIPNTEVTGSSVSGNNEECVQNKKKSSPRKSPKARRKVFTPKSRKRTNKNQTLNCKNNVSEGITVENKEVVKIGKPCVEEKLEKSTSAQQCSVKNESIKTKINKKTEKAEPKPAKIKNRKRRSSRRNTGTEKESEDENILLTDRKENKDDEVEEEVGGKRRKIKGRRVSNKKVRKSVEEKRNTKSSSEEESPNNERKESKKSPALAKKKATKGTTMEKSTTKLKSRTSSPPKTKKEDTETHNTSEELVQATKKKKSRKTQGRHSRAFLGIDLNIDLSDTSRSVRQSSRLAQIKIKEQVDHKHEEIRQPIEKSSKKIKKKKEENEENQKGTPKKKNKAKVEEEVPDVETPEKKKGRKKKKKHPVKAFNERDPWKSSSGSSSDVEEEEEDHFDEIVEEEEELCINLKSDHEFSPESDLEGDEDFKPIRRARTAQKDSLTEEGDDKDQDDFACEKCGKKDHPEWILLCDTCDHGWHASCLRPSLMLIPEGDWHCPPCQHTVLVKRLQETLKIFDRDTKRRENEELRKKRLAYVGISLDNVLPSGVNQQLRDKSGSESSESSRSSSESESEYSDEPVYQLRQRRQGTTSYRFNEFDELINSAIQDEVEGKHSILKLVPENKPLSINKEVPEIKANEVGVPENQTELKVEGENKTVISAEKATEEKVEKIKKNDKDESGEDSSDDDEDEDDEEEEEEFPSVVPKRNNILPRPGKKKHRRLNCLDDPSDDDDGSDEDFKGSSSEEEEDEDDDEDDSDESDIGRRGRSKRGHLGPVRRSSRARRSRFDKEFINDNSDESDAPRRKKTRKLWTDSESESDDSTWGRRKKKKSNGTSGRRKKNKKFIIEDELSEIESSKIPKKKRQRKIKYGGLDDINVEELPTRRTRGKKINYQEVLGSESDEDIQKAKNFKRAIIEDDEFVAEKEDEKEETGTSSGECEESEYERNSKDEVVKEIKIQDNTENKQTFENNIEKPKQDPMLPITSPPKVLNKEKPVPGRRGRPPKAMIAPPPERLITEDEQYKAIVSKVSTLGNSDKPISDETEINLVKRVNISEHTNISSDPKAFLEPGQSLTPIKIQNNSFDPKLVKRSPPIKIRSGVPVNTGGRKSPALPSPTKETSFFPVKSPPNPGIIHSPPERLQLPLQMNRTLVPIQTGIQQFTSARKSINPALTNIKSENIANEEELDDLDEEDLMDDIEEEEEEEDDSDDDILEEGEIPKKVARRMARMEERLQQKLEERRLARQQMKPVKSIQPGAGTTVNQSVISGPTDPPAKPNEQKPTPTTQPTQPLLRVVSPLKLMANPPGPLQSTFMHSGINPRMPVSSPPPARMPISMRPSLQTNLMPVMNVDDGSAAKRRGRGRGKKQLAQEKPEQDIIGGASVIRGMLQQPQSSYPPTHYPQQYPNHPRIPFSPQRMPRPPFHPGHHPLDPSPSGGGTVNIKQEPGGHPPSTNPVHIPNKPPTSSAGPYHPHPPPHRFESGHPRQQTYPPPPQGNPPTKQQYGSFPPHPNPSANYHYGSYPPPMSPMSSREEPQSYPVQQSYNEQFSDQSPTPTVPPSSKGYSEEESGEFGGLVSYFSSQREDDIDT